METEMTVSKGAVTSAKLATVAAAATSMARNRSRKEGRPEDDSTRDISKIRYQGESCWSAHSTEGVKVSTSERARYNKANGLQ